MLKDFETKADEIFVALLSGLGYSGNFIFQIQDC